MYVFLGLRAIECKKFAYSLRALFYSVFRYVKSVRLTFVQCKPHYDFKSWSQLCPEGYKNVEIIIRGLIANKTVNH